MPIQTPTISGLDTLFLFPYFSTREEYQKATGQAPPPWDPKRPPKYWFDPKAMDSPRRIVIYDSVLAVSENGTLLRDDQNRPAIDTLVLQKEIAATVNIPPKGPNSTNIPGADQPEVQMPLRSLADNEELFFRFGGVVAVRNKETYAFTQVGFTYQDRLLLQSIAHKLGL